MSQVSFLVFPVLSRDLFSGAFAPIRGILRSLSLASRFLNGMLNGNAGVVKSMMVELTDETNMARGFSLIPVTWAVGGTLGSDVFLLPLVYSLIYYSVP